MSPAAVGREPPRAAARGPIVPLQFLRGVAASMVVAEHLLERYRLRGALDRPLPAFCDHLGAAGVFTFFAISGLIITRTTRDLPAGTATGAAFLRSRFWRVAPLYYLTTLLIVAFEASTRTLSGAAMRWPSASDWWLSAAFVPHRGRNGLLQPVYGLGWTLQYEMFFYALFALGLAAAGRRGVPLVLAVLALLLAAGPLAAVPGDAWTLAAPFYVLTRPVLLYFMLGIGIALLHERWKARVSLPGYVAGAVALGGVLLAAAAIDRRVVALAAVGVALAACVLVAPRPARSLPLRRGGVLARAFGDASYSIYLTHSFLLGAFAAVTAPLAAGGIAGLLACLAAAVLLCAVVGWCTWHWIERPLTRRLRGERPRAAEMVAP